MWFTENPWPPMLVCAIAALACFGLWNTDRRNLYFFFAWTFLAMTGGIYAVERVIVTEGERLQGTVVEMCHQFRNRDPQTLTHFSETAPEWKSVCETAMKMVEIRDDLRLTDFATTITHENSRATVHFRANATISAMGATAHHPFRCILSFRKEGGLWKIVDVERLDPINGTKMEVMEHR
jgi:hypothetical protein